MEFEQQQTWKTRLKSYLKECWRVLRITKKPSAEEFKVIVKVSGIGMAVIGLIGFLINMMKQLLF
ncbi:protein translocase SEC61 complex subunit gamma [Candidatus Woesearchaeota archaeon]|nr:protein translocase SEC61 complex subunit gamma [Candidatus Woesearchaeota archaeon]